ncbi:hypothetical protein QEJ31_02745 [Pigmentibacter sp. JX0631]|uniref:hypothetical protein n=1 Tax=Pigmentibacter sp. JX0631 TaxID=2976982 RepID=UPI0024684C97|nr:hypothetical protein [Pigmentibacter sp. JX0631]WGL60518.1 hypothetical protein QEJ31_02745 [Pigmentibacter sp. JX0631]
MSDNENIIEEDKTQSHPILKDKKEITEQMKAWKNFLDNTIGFVSFNFAISCSGLEGIKSLLWPSLSIAFILVLMFKTDDIFPKSIIDLRNKKNKTDEDKKYLIIFEKNLFNLEKADLFIEEKDKIKKRFISFCNDLKETPLYWIGFISLLGVLFCNIRTFSIHN